ncbi:MAG: hypothetical protein JSS09_05560 [Verrucomicrobia bacterium]|nr:hypothetical protein [Verrucomicrobiota bacterium]
MEKISGCLKSYENTALEENSLTNIKITLLIASGLLLSRAFFTSVLSVRSHPLENRIEAVLLKDLKKKPNGNEVVLSETFIGKILASKTETKQDDKKWTLEVLSKIEPYYLAPYTDCYSKATRLIDGKKYVVERYNHGLAHGLRQGALAKDVFNLLLQLKKSASFPTLNQKEPILKWAEEKIKKDPNYLRKVEMVSSFQRSGRQGEISSSDNLTLYKKYELQDSINFTKAARETDIFLNEEEIKTFAEAMFTMNFGSLNVSNNDDLKYLKCILQSAHTFDLRRIPSFDKQIIKSRGTLQLFKERFSSSEEYRKITDLLWDRSGEYLKVTGDRDLETGKDLEDLFFLQAPEEIVEAIYQVDEICLA